MFFNFKKRKAEKQAAAAAKQAEEQKRLEEQKKLEEKKEKEAAAAQAKDSKKSKKTATLAKAKTDTAETSKTATSAKVKATTPKTTNKETKKQEPKAEGTSSKVAAKKTAKVSTAKAEPAKKAPTPKDTTNQDLQATSGPRGKFAYYRTAKGYYNYRLKASNNETIAVSGGTGYAALSGCKAGIESVRKNINAPIEDQTLKTYETLPNPKFVLFKDKAGKFRYRLFARNGELICTPEDGYSSKDACKKGIASLAKWALNSDVVADD